MAKKRVSVSQIQQIAKETFGYDRLRPEQEQVIQAVLDGHDTLAVMPTGSGKSAIYQIAALLRTRFHGRNLSPNCPPT